MLKPFCSVALCSGQCLHISQVLSCPRIVQQNTGHLQCRYIWLSHDPICSQLCKKTCATLEFHTNTRLRFALLQIICLATCCFCGLVQYQQCLQQIKQQDHASLHWETDSGPMQTSPNFSLPHYQHHKADNGLGQFFIPPKKHRMTMFRHLQMDYKPKVKCCCLLL